MPVLQSRGKFKLEQNGNEYIILNGTRIYKKYKSQTWAEKKYSRLARIFTKE